MRTTIPLQRPFHPADMPRNPEREAPIRNAKSDRAHRRFLIEQELAERWSKSRRTLQRIRVDGSGPAYHRVGGSILYKIEDIEAFQASSRGEGKG